MTNEFSAESQLSERMRLLLDANVLASAVKRDIFLTFAESEMFDIFWSPQILNETHKTLVHIFDKNGIAPEPADIKAKLSIVRMMDRHPDSMVDNLDSIFRVKSRGLLPDPNDFHVVESAYICGADVIVTENLRDFPDDRVNQFSTLKDIRVMNSDTLIVETLASNTADCLDNIKLIRNRLKKPPMDVETLLNVWRDRHNLHKTVEFLQMFKNQI